MKTVIILNTDVMGHGDRVLGRKILSAFLARCRSMHEVSAVVFYNSGVHLVSKDSPVLGILHELHEHGVDLLPCMTCLDHFGLEPAVGQASDMDEIIRELDSAERVITL
ncbi:MAG: DsrE family protein [Phycisphaerales bacterium]|nr:DsrE family protein [Phycisphaerales bacterium]